MDKIVETPWDKRVFNINTYEIREVTKSVLERIKNIHGHYTAKVDPLVSKELLHKFGFYYCDTLMEPYCNKEQLLHYNHTDITIRKEGSAEELLSISHGAYSHGRFHRDFNVDRELADLRYDNWSKELYEKGNCIFLYFQEDVAGYFGVENNKVVLHALKEKYRGRGLAKPFWSLAYRYIFDSGFNEATSSISSCNSAILNLYTSIGFRFRNPIDVYHLLVQQKNYI
jgi:ribosomal protein S18 acetylase RimI-like enzyme